MGSSPTLDMKSRVTELATETDARTKHRHMLAAVKVPGSHIETNPANGV